MTDHQVIKYPQVTEKAMNKMDFENKLQFVCDIDATKGEIVDAVEQQFDVGVEDVNTMVTTDGDKKAEVRLSPDDDAQEVASRIGVF
ncbi:50S ribosomal protein L23 [Halapricum sp. CBA1109]|jgi:large subunit ribosomal protein L23|uniref:50S ribosomal protein L23 n=1 Tax=Halapricum sp. CBA1109 TaxID=2668068 RepID=UPI0012FBD8AC|nr:50S ribosomal protein L23 [Halapricum sp. CBA1109]MUV89026.1 50S ribosomal protein L23 [Halapricum sp. CBA1109]